MKRVLVLLLFVATSAQGEIYTWTDARGTAHYTNSMYDVPDRYRAKVKVLDLGEKKAEGPAPQQGGPVQQAQPAVPAAPPPAGGGIATPNTPPESPVVKPDNRGQRREERRQGRRRLRHNGATGVED